MVNIARSHVSSIDRDWTVIVVLLPADHPLADHHRDQHHGGKDRADDQTSEQNQDLLLSGDAVTAAVVSGVTAGPGVDPGHVRPTSG